MTDVKLRQPAPRSHESLDAAVEVALAAAGEDAGKRAALELTERARAETGRTTGFAGSLFMGRAPWELLDPYPEPSSSAHARGTDFLGGLRAFLRDEVDADAIDRTGEIPAEIIVGLATLGAFGIKIPREYGGLGLSQVDYTRAAILLGSHCANTTALLSAHQSIGVPQPLLLFGTEEQKRRFLPRLAAGEISAFALTEDGAGSDPARMTTRAEPTSDGRHFVLNGKKLWCTNGTRAGLLVVMARTPPREIRGRRREQITAFVVEADAPGVHVEHRSRFMGLRALYNGVIRFDDVRVPRSNILGAEGEGMKVALTTLNTGRLTLPAACTGLSKRCLAITRRWAGEREQWGSPIGRHGAIADKIARMAATVFAMESMTLLTSALVDRGDDIRIEAAMAKLWCTEAAWQLVNDTVQIRGGRGYETAQSLAARGDAPIPVERFLRDTRINTIFEGSSEIMRLFIAREALDPHLRVAGDALNPRNPTGRRLRGALRAARFYCGWYPATWFAWGGAPRRWHPDVARHARFVARTSRRLARALFHSMARHGPALEKRQLLLGQLVDAGTELFAIGASCTRAQHLLASGKPPDTVVPVLDLFCRGSRRRIRHALRALRQDDHLVNDRLAADVLSGHLRWLESGTTNADSVPSHPSGPTMPR